jgi:inner membrane transporter RhtA
LKAITAPLDQTSPTLLLLLAITSIQFGSAIAITLFSLYGPVEVLFLRQTLAGAFLCLLYRHAIADALRRAPLGILLLSLAMVASAVLFYEALARIPLGIAVSIEFLGPLGVALATSRRLVDLVCVLLAGAGIYLLTPAIGTSLDLDGVLFAFASAIGWAGYIFVSRHVGQKVEGGVCLALAMGLAALLLLPFAGPSALTTLRDQPISLASIAGVAVFSAAIPVLFEFLALKTMPPRKYGVLVSLEPVLATLVGIVVLAERIGLRAWIAMLLITIASAGVALASRREAAAEPPVADVHQ